jgi:predicted ester cyclase
MSPIDGNGQEERNKNIIRSFIEEIFNEHNLPSIEKYFGKDSIEDSPHAGKSGKEFKQFLTDFFDAFPDMHTTIEHMVAENNLVMVFLNGSGTHKGEFCRVEPTNKKIRIRSADLYRIENDIINGHWDIVDELDFLKQIGVLLSEPANKDPNDSRVVWIHDYE